ncbi:JM137 [macacine gammaherpesvirus 11]|uniref:JM137 n=2 Tax=macacine gammaherpesvirus 11 TaxID=2560570 RepID=G9JMW5_9GAMA|nr:JM137 [Macaca fuscata rhadinovirus]AAT00114.1 JM137 [Macaca fuscata rhadinovirus]AEW87662.1 JM137 [Macaca fuscata rhadinovirus]AEW87832.1 JM137 [Macaca fuscata rhadinovirus]
MSSGKRLVDELCDVVVSYLGPSGISLDLERCQDGAPVYAKGGAVPVCTVRLQHGCVYHLEFVYKFWLHKLERLAYPFAPCFVITNNGLATTLKCFLCKPRDADAQFGKNLPINSDVYLERNSSVFLGQDDFMKFKARLVFSGDLNVYSSMVICRTYFTEHRQVLQFLVVTPKSAKRLKTLLRTVFALTGHSDGLGALRRTGSVARPSGSELTDIGSGERCGNDRLTDSIGTIGGWPRGACLTWLKTKLPVMGAFLILSIIGWIVLGWA